MRLVERRERNETAKLGDDLGVNSHRPLEDGTAVDDAMPHRNQTVLREFAFEPAKKRRERILMGCALR
jgi:hypothetical protein